MNVSIHRGLSRMISNLSWSHFTRFALINHQITINPGMKISNLNSKKISLCKNEYLVFEIIAFQSLSIDLKNGREFAYTMLNNT